MPSINGVKFETFPNFFTRRYKNMLLYQRQQEILNYLSKNKWATVKELAKVVFASESSVRRDIKALEQKGFVKEVYGGVTLPYENTVVPMILRENMNSSVKDELAKEAAKHIFDGATIIMDNSSTVRRLMKYLTNFKMLKIITNSQRIITECDSDGIELYCTGGRFIKQNNVFVGSTAENYIKNIYADILFFSSQAISDEGEISDISEEETNLRKIMLSRASKKIFLCDSSKIGLKKTFTLCTKDDVDEIICDSKMPFDI